MTVSSRTSPFDTEFISLASLMKNTDLYESLPVLIQDNLKRSVWWTLLVDILFLTAAWLLGPMSQHYVTSPGFFIVTPLAILYNAGIATLDILMPALIVINLGSLLVTLVVLLLSAFMTQPVHEPVHWLAMVASAPTMLTFGTAVVAGVLVGTAIAIATIIWLIVFAIGFLVFMSMMRNGG